MYLRELFIKNSGPIRDFHLELTFEQNDLPIPHVIVGRNGTGKTNLLSIIAEALMFGANSAFDDVLARKGLAHSFFRVLGGRTLTYGESGGFSILQFKDGDINLFYRENAGEFSVDQALELIPARLNPGAKWNEKEPTKTFEIEKEKARDIYQEGVYVYFPSSRSEQPHWFNQDSIIQDEYDVTDRYKSRLDRPMFVERGIDDFAQWLLGVITESRLPIKTAAYLTDEENEEIKKEELIIRVPTEPYMRTQRPLILANKIIKAILDDPDARFDWAGRLNSKKVGVYSGNKTLASGLDSLSGGQATLLAIFGTILRYGDRGTISTSEPEAEQGMNGVVIIDELDAHMHIDLQMKAIPELISMFPKIQFILSSHSPFFALGMEKRFPESGVRIVDLPTGLSLSAETYEEFGSALSVLMETHVFEAKIGQFLAAAEDPVVWVAGETDVPYFKTAARLLGYPQLVPYFQWIGEPGQSGGGRNTGDDALKALVKFLRANPGFTHRITVIVYDNDAGQVDDAFDSIHVIALPKVECGGVEDGIENMLPGHLITDDVIQMKEISSGIEGKPKIIPELRKSMLSQRLCGDEADPANFQNFAPILQRINELVAIDANIADDGASLTGQESAESPPGQA
jgi:hypothetical protein